MASTPTSIPAKRLAIVGGGPAGLMAAEVASAAGVAVDLYEGKGSVGRKLLIAGKGGLNLTHSEDTESFVDRYGKRREQVAEWLRVFNADAVREWARSLHVETFIGSSGRVFPADLKAAPLLRNWVRRLREQGVRFHVNHYCLGFEGNALRFKTPTGEQLVHADAIVLATGGASWPQLGSDGAWVSWLQTRGVDVAALQSANCGFDVGWSEVFSKRFAGQPVKSVVVTTIDEHGNTRQQQGEFVITATGVEGSVIYALSAQLRDDIDKHANQKGSATVYLDLAPQRDHERLLRELSLPRKGRSLTEHLRRSVGIDGVKTGLLYEVLSKDEMSDSHSLAAAIKSLPIKLIGARPIAEAISSAGGVRLKSCDETLMIKSLPGVFCAGEMLDWEAPTGGYLLTACFASGRLAGASAAQWLLKAD